MRDEYAAALIDRCRDAYPSGFNYDDDLRSVQTVADYAAPLNQFKYVHMYFAKSVMLWSRVRELLGADAESDLWSIGAGPMLDLFGWFWDQPKGAGNVIAVDALDWGAVRTSEEWRQLAAVLLPQHQYLQDVVIPKPGLAPQCSGLTTSKALSPESVANGATVILPFVLNHLLGVHSPMTQAGHEALVDWINNIRRREGRIIFADMPSTKAANFWNTLRQLFDIDAEPSVIDFSQDIKNLRNLYANDGQGGRRCSHHLADATVLVLDPSGARFLSGV